MCVSFCRWLTTKVLKILTASKSLTVFWVPRRLVRVAQAPRGRCLLASEAVLPFGPQRPAVSLGIPIL